MTDQQCKDQQIASLCERLHRHNYEDKYSDFLSEFTENAIVSAYECAVNDSKLSTDKTKEFIVTGDMIERFHDYQFDIVQEGKSIRDHLTEFHCKIYNEILTAIRASQLQ